MSRVPRPMRMTNNPVANGSSVPVWPTRRDEAARRTMETTSCDVMPAGLSTSSNPPVSAVGVSIRRDSSVFDLREKILDAGRVGDAFIGLEADLGGKAQAKRTADARTQMPGNTRQALERHRALGVGSHHAHEHLGVPQVVRHFGARDCD